MIAVQLYQILYLLMVFVLSLSVYNRYKKRTDAVQTSKNASTGLIVLVLFLIFVIGLRPASGKYFVDMVNYIQAYDAFYDGVPFSFNWDVDSLLFDNYLALVGSFRLGTEFFFTTIAAIYFGAAFWGIKKMFPNDTMAAYLVFLGAFSTFSYATNGIKAGAAASLFILALAYRENLKICIPFVLISLGFHHSMILPVVAFVLTLVYKNPKVYLATWCLCLIASALHITFFQDLFARIIVDTMDDTTGANYLQSVGSEWGGKSGFRLDFILYSAIPVLVGYWAIYKKKIQLSKSYICLLDVYLCTNGIWMLCMYAEFTNRIAYLSWFLYPVLLIYPYLNENWGQSRYRSFAQVMLVHIGFTIFMSLIYYGGLRSLLG